MKGVVDIEFIISVLVFLVTISFTIITIGRQVPSLEEDALTDDIKANGYQISEILLFGKGEPQDWETKSIDEIKRFGLSTDKNYILSKNKIDTLETFCDTSYENVRSKFGISQEISLYAAVIGESRVLLDCTPAHESTARPRFTTRRFATFSEGGKLQLLEINVTLIA